MVISFLWTKEKTEKKGEKTAYQMIENSGWIQER